MASHKIENFEKLEKIADKLSVMDRVGLIEELHRIQCNFSIDFTQEFLNSVSVERLRHIVLAASLHDCQGSNEKWLTS